MHFTFGRQDAEGRTQTERPVQGELAKKNTAACKPPHVTPRAKAGDLFFKDLSRHGEFP